MTTMATGDDDLRTRRAVKRELIDQNGNGFLQNAVPSKFFHVFRPRLGRWILAATLINPDGAEMQEAIARVRARFNLPREKVKHVFCDTPDVAEALSIIFQKESNE